MTSTPIRILIVDDHVVVREGLAELIQRQSDMIVVGEASNGQEAIEAFERLRPDVTLMDLHLPVLDGRTAIRQICARWPQARILVLTIDEGDENIYRCLQAGAKGYLLKSAHRSDMLQAICMVAAGQTYLSPEAAARLAEHLQHPELTDRELEVLRLMAEGHSNAEIGVKLFISEGTVKAHINHILAKLNVQDRTSAVVQAIKRGLVAMQ